MELPDTTRHGDRPNDSTLRALAVLIGVALLVIGLTILASALVSRGVGFSLSGRTIGASVAIVVGGVLGYRGFRRPRSRAAGDEASLSKLVERYEREGKTKELEDAREQLIQLLIEKDEQNPKAPR